MSFTTAHDPTSDCSDCGAVFNGWDSTYQCDACDLYFCYACRPDCVDREDGTTYWTSCCVCVAEEP